MNAESDMNQSSVERLKEKLYRRGVETQERPRRLLKEHHDFSAQPSWKNEKSEHAQHETNDSPVPELRASALRRNKRTAGAFIWWFFDVSILFFIGALGFSVYFFSSGANSISCENVDITVSGPASVASGRGIPVTVSLHNRNGVALLESYLTIEYPEGTRSAEDINTLRPTTRERIGTLQSGESVRITDEVVIFGTEKTAKTVTARFEYQIAESSTLFRCEGTYRVLIATSPVTLSVEGLEEISSGQEVELMLRVSSNAEEVVPDMRIVAEYPFGFTFQGAEPAPSSGTHVWDIGDIAQGMDYVVRVRGVMQAQGTEARVVRFSLGEKDTTSSEKVLSALQLVNHPLLVTRPFFAINIRSEEQRGTKISVTPKETVSITFDWENILSYELYDVEVSAHVPSAFINQKKVSVRNGYYNSRDDVIVWTPQTYPLFATVPAGAKDNLSFTIETIDPSVSGSVRDPSIPISFTIRARRLVNEQAVAQVLYDQSPVTLQFETQLSVDAYVLHSAGPIENNGPIPPRAERETSYTLVFEVRNTTSDVDAVEVSTKLPVNVTWTGVYSPQTEPIAYNPITQRITWNVGDISSHTGNRTQPRVVYVQVRVLPSLTDIGDELPLTTSVYTSGTDRFTKRPIRLTVPALDTRMPRDPLRMQNIGDVVE